MRVIWIGLGLLCFGLLILAITDLIWPEGDTPFHKWGRQIGLLLFLLGITLSVLAT